MELVKRYRAPARGAAHELKLGPFAAIERGPGPALTGSSSVRAGCDSKFQVLQQIPGASFFC
jgi:hypothetical protein